MEAPLGNLKGGRIYACIPISSEKSIHLNAPKCMMEERS